MAVASFFSWEDRVESYLVENPEDRFSRHEARIRIEEETQQPTKHRNRACIITRAQQILGPRKVFQQLNDEHKKEN